MSEAQRIVDEQADDDSLWFVPDSVIEAYFQQELRRLHAAFEGDTALKETQHKTTCAVTATGHTAPCSCGASVEGEG